MTVQNGLCSCMRSTVIYLESLYNEIFYQVTMQMFIQYGAHHSAIITTHERYAALESL